MRMCWAVQREEAPGRGFFAVWVVVFSRFGEFCVPIGLVCLYDTRSVRGYSIHTLSLVVWYTVCTGLFNTPSLSY